MNEEEIKIILDEVMQEVNGGKYVTLEQFKKNVEELHGIKLKV